MKWEDGMPLSDFISYLCKWFFYSILKKLSKNLYTTNNNIIILYL
jgi:hypothetical protein